MSRREREESAQLNVQKLLDIAVQHHSAGRLREAENNYREVLEVAPDNPVALQLLGVLAYQVGDVPSAFELISAAVAVDPNYAEAHFHLGLACKAQGRFDEAIESYQRSIELNPAHPQAHNNLANTYQAIGRLDEAATSYRKALSFDPNYVNALSNLGVVLANLRQPEAAVHSCRKAVQLDPENADVHSNLGFVLLELGKAGDAISCFRTALTFEPEDPETHNNLGNAFQEQDRLEDAIMSYQKAVELAPNYTDAQNNLGNVFHELERYDDAVLCYRTVLECEPENVDAYNNLGLVLQDQGRFADAVASYRKAITIDPNYANAHSNIGLSLNALGQTERSIKHFDTFLTLTRGPECDSPGKGFRTISKAKIDHDIEQFRYLDDRLGGTDEFAAHAEAYETLRDQIRWPTGDDFLVTLSEDQYEPIKASYNRPVHRADAPRVPGSALSEEIDVADVTRQYFENAPGMVSVDGILAPEVMKSLRRFLLESTIWFDFRYRGGYLGAFLNDGLACPLVFQIAEGFQQKFPEIFEDHKLLQCWAYKYDSRLTGIDVHADAAAVNVNFWVTPSSSNLNPESGGLVVHKVEAPLDWRFKSYNTDQPRIRKFLAENDLGKMVVPHAENRVVLFNSDLFHETDTIEFKPDYENRRINVTMLFGHRRD